MAALAVALLSLARLSAVQDARATPAALETLWLRPSFAVIGGAGANIGVQLGDDGVIVVDGGDAARAADVTTAVERVSPRSIRYVIDTSADADHVGGNQVVAKAGRTLFILNALGQGLTGGGAAAILSVEAVLRRMSAPGASQAYPVAAWPTETFETGRKYMYLNGEGIEVRHQPAAHTDGDAVVYFRKSDVVMAGDIIDTRHFPVIDVARGGSIQGEIAALNALVDLAIPSVPIVSSTEAGTYVVPGHGYVLDQLDVVEYRDMVTIIRDRIRALRSEGRSLDEVVAANPTAGYTARYGADTGPWTTRQFVEAIYQGVAPGERGGGR